MPLSDGEAKQVAYGALNAVEVKKAQSTPDPSAGGSMRIMKNAALKAITPEAQKGTGPYRGIVLRKEPDITGTPGEGLSDGLIPRDSWLNNYFVNESEDGEHMPYDLKAFKVYIPEFHADLPKVKKYPAYTQADPEHVKINRYPTFIARDSNVEDAQPGDIVWVDFGNRLNFTDPVYLGPVFPPPQTGPGDSTGAGQAMNQPCGGGSASPAPGAGLGYMDEYRRLAQENASQTYRDHPNLAYAPYNVQAQACQADPAGSTVGSEGYFTNAAQNNSSGSCVRCYNTNTPENRGSDANGRSHAYKEDFVRYIEQGGRNLAVSGRIGVGCLREMPTRIEKMLMGMRLVAEDQVGRGYGFGCKDANYTQYGIDCSGLTHLARCMIEVMMDDGSGNFNAYGNSKFTGWTGKGHRASGESSPASPSSPASDLPWASAEYFSNSAAGRMNFPENVYGLGGSPMWSFPSNYRRGIVRSLTSYSETDNTDPNVEWGTSESHVPVMPGDMILIGRRNSIGPDHQVMSNSSTEIRVGTRARPHNSTHILTTFSGPDGVLRTLESEGPNGVVTKLFPEWFERYRQNWGIFVYEPEEMRTAWAECADLCREKDIPHKNGRPTVPWTPEIAKKIGPTLFASIPPEEAESQGVMGTLFNTLASAFTSEGTAESAATRTEPQPEAEGTAPLAPGANQPEGATAVDPQPPSQQEGAETPPAESSEPQQTQPNSTAASTQPSGQTGTGGSSAPASCGAGGGSGGGGGGGFSGGPSAPNPAYQGEGVPLSQPRAQSVRLQFDDIRYDFCAGNGGSRAALREDAANDMAGILDVLHNLGCVLPSGGTGRGLGNYDPSNTNRSTTSFHYTYLAFDIYTHCGSLYPRSNPEICEFVVTYDANGGPSGNRMWVVYARSDGQPGTEYNGHRIETLTLDARICPRGTRGEPIVQQVTGNFVNLTQLMRSYNFHPIPGRRSYFSNCSGNTMGSEWWHFQSHSNLNSGDTWEGTMTKFHSQQRFNCSPVAQHRRRVFRNLGFSGRGQDVTWNPC